MLVVQKMLDNDRLVKKGNAEVTVSLAEARKTVAAIQDGKISDRSTLQ